MIAACPRCGRPTAYVMSDTGRLLQVDAYTDSDRGHVPKHDPDGRYRWTGEKTRNHAGWMVHVVTYDTGCAPGVRFRAHKSTCIRRSDRRAA